MCMLATVQYSTVKGYSTVTSVDSSTIGVVRV